MKLYFAILLLFFASSTMAQEINYKSLENEGFGEVSKVLKNMSPEQRKHVLQQAESMRPELEKMSSQEIEELEVQMRAMSNSIDASQIDASKLDTSKDQDLDTIRNDVRGYLTNQ